MSVTFAMLGPSHLMELELQAAQRREAGRERIMTREDARAVVDSGEGWAVLDDSDRVLCCAGFSETFRGVQGVAWALIAEGVTLRQHLEILAFGARMVAESPLRRIEAIVDAARPEAARWATRMGLTLAHRLECWGAASTPHLLFERIRGES